MEHRIKPSSKGYAEPIKGKPGSFRLYFSLGKNPNGKGYLRTPKRTYHCRSKNPKNWRTECDHALADYRAELEGAKRSLERETRTMSDYADDFHSMREGTMGSPLAYDREGYDVRHIRELFADTPIDALRPDDIRHAYARARESGRFKESEIRRVHTKLKQIMQDAVDNELIDRNPCNTVKLPKANVEARQSLSAEDASRLQKCLLEERPSSSVTCTMLLLQCGLRKGESLGLSWKDYDSESRKIHVRKQYTNDKTLRAPKSKMSRRSIHIGETLANYLNTWKESQKAILQKYGIEQNGDTPIVHGMSVVETEDGKRAIVVRVEGHNYSRWFRDFCVDNEFGKYETITGTFVRDGKLHVRGKNYRGLVPHALRHTQATLLIGDGADVKTVQARLGHASPSTTLSIYAHAIEANDQAAANAFDGIIG